MTYDDYKLETPEDEHYRKNGYPRRGVYAVTVVRTIETVVEVEASSPEDAEQDAKHGLPPLEAWTVLDEDVVVQEPDDDR